MNGPAVGAPLPWGQLSPAEQRALLRLLEVHTNAIRCGCDPWQFALTLREIECEGIAISVLRCLVQLRLAAHGHESTEAASQRRIISHADHLLIADHSCFIASDAGINIGSALVQDHNQTNIIICATVQVGSRPTCIVPCFCRCDDGHRELTVLGRLVKRFRRYALTQEPLLEAFQDAGWVQYLPNPLRRIRGNPKVHLHDAIGKLNKDQVNPLIQFRGDGNGCGVRWQLQLGE
jgi:hypothetical protein